MDLDEYFIKVSQSISETDKLQDKFRAKIEQAKADPLYSDPETSSVMQFIVLDFEEQIKKLEEDKVALMQIVQSLRVKRGIKLQ